MISDLQTLKSFFREHCTTPIFGVDVYAFDRLGPEDFLANYGLLALRHSLDTELIEKDIELLSLEKGMGTKHINAPRNSTTVLCHPKTKEYISLRHLANKNPAFIVYKSSLKMERLCAENGWTLIAQPVKFGKRYFEDKIKFRRILEEINLSPPPGEVAYVKNLEFSALKQKYGVPFVLQHPRRGGGKGTFFIHSKKEWQNAIQRLSVREKEEEEVKEDTAKLEVIITRYITGLAVSITGCVTRHGVLSTSPQYQLIDIPELYNQKKGSGLFCGHDWSRSRFPSNVEQQAYDAVEKVGAYFQKLGYKGIFGLDFMLEEKSQKLAITECNPRLLGSFPVITMAQLGNGEPPILAFHILEYLGIDYEIEKEKINAAMRVRRSGAQMFLHNLTGKWTKNNNEVRPGVYRLNREFELEFVRPGYALKHILNENEFLLTDGVLPKGSHFSPNRRLCRIVTLREILGDDKKTLSPWAKEVAHAVHEAFGLKPVRFAKFIKLFKKDFLLKG